MFIISVFADENTPHKYGDSNQGKQPKQLHLLFNNETTDKCGHLMAIGVL